MPADLDKLAARGDQARREQQAADAREDQQREGRRVEMAMISTTSLGVLRTYIGGVLIAFPTLALSAYLLMWPAFRGDIMSMPERVLHVIAPFATALAAVLATRALVLVAARGTYQRTLASFQALPFEVTAIEKLLAESPSRKAVEARIAMQPGTDLERVTSLIAGLNNPRITARVADGTVVVRLAVAGQLDERRTAPETNRRALGLFQSLVRGLLLDVHARTPITSIAF